MAQDSSLNQPQVFQCHRCREIINASLTNCPYCGAVVNHDAEITDDVQSLSRKAHGHAYLLKIMARALAGFFLALSLSFFDEVSLPGFLLLLIVLPGLLIGWWVKYRALRAGGQNHTSAKHDAVIATVIWCGVLVAWLAASLIQSLMLMLR